MSKMRGDSPLPREASKDHASAHLVSPEATIPELKKKALDC